MWRGVQPREGTRTGVSAGRDLYCSDILQHMLQHYCTRSRIYVPDDEEMSVLDTYEEGRRARRAIATCRPLWFFLEGPNFCLFFVNDKRRHVSLHFWGGLVPDHGSWGDRRCAS